MRKAHPQRRFFSVGPKFLRVAGVRFVLNPKGVMVALGPTYLTHWRPKSCGARVVRAAIALLGG